MGASIRSLGRALSSPLYARSLLCPRIAFKCSPVTTLAPTIPFTHTVHPQPRSSTLGFTENKIWNAVHRETRIRSRPSPLHRYGQPPPPGRRPPWLDRIPQDFIFFGIMAVNGVVFLMWQFASSQLREGNPKLFILMRDNFLCSMKNFESGRIWTLITSCFSHESPSHILFNGFTYYFFGRSVLGVLGSTRFLVLYLGGGIISGFVSMCYNGAIKQRDNYASHGASGAIYALLSFVACISPSSKVMLYGIVPIPAWALVSMIFLYDGYRAVSDKHSGTDSAGHVGGLLAGVAYFLARLV